MNAIILDGEEFAFQPLEDVLAKTGVDPQAFQPLLFNNSSNLIWTDKEIWEHIFHILSASVNTSIDLSKLPDLPDQLAILLRAELTTAGMKYELTAEEKDESEQRLQNALRPIVYAIIQQRLTQSAEFTLDSVLNESLVMGWNRLQIDEWSICELLSLFGPIGWYFQHLQNSDEKFLASVEWDEEKKFLQRLGNHLIDSLI